MRRRDLIIVGGGISGSALAMVMARAGLDVLVLEKTRAFTDENRGELLWPWGVREAQSIGAFDVLIEAGAHVVPWLRSYTDLNPGEEHAVDLSKVVDGVPGSVNLGHPAARQALLDAAVSAGAEVVRGVRDVTVLRGGRPRVQWRSNGRDVASTCRLVVGADGRHSRVRQQAGIALYKGDVEMYSAGMLVRGSEIPSDANVGARERDTMLLSFPQEDGFVRLYQCFPVEARRRYDGRDRAERFIAACSLDSLPGAERWLAAEPAGPCSTFPCSDSWVETPVVEGIMLVGDAAGYNNFLIGQGLSLAMRDVAVLSELLLANDEWSAPRLQPYGRERVVRLQKARYLAHLTGWRTRWFHDAPTAREAAARLAAHDGLLSQFRGDSLSGYLSDTDVPMDALWARLDQLERDIPVPVA